MESLLNIKRKPVGEVVGKLKDDSAGTSMEAGQKLVREAAGFGLSVRDYLTLSVKPEGDLNGYETALAELNLPFKNDFEKGIVLQAASNTFQTYPGTRAMFPEVIDDMLRWSARQDQFETVAPMLAGSRTINGVEMVSTVVNSDGSDGEYDTHTVPEGARIPVRSLRTSESAVKMWKHGSALRTTYEFNRRVSLDILAPHARRIARELEISKAKAGYSVLVNGDGVHSAANTVAQSSYDSTTGATSTSGQVNWTNLLYWLVQRAKAGMPVDTLIGSWDSAFAWSKMWSIGGSDTRADAQNFQAMAGQMTMGGLNVPLPRFVVCSAAPANKILGITAGETLEELIEAGSAIQESERSILNQTVNYVRSEVTGYRLVYGDTREIFDFGS